ncbi:MAG: PucR family transcriptional regulator [Bacillus sp. (in: firmicutes)]
MDTYSSVSDILKRRLFHDIEVIAGEEGLYRPVKWVHIVEVTNIRNLLKGDELILSTCVAWAKNEDIFISMIRQFIEANAAGLCIEIGTYTSTIPYEAIRIAEENHFPIIIFRQEVSFVEITQDIHTFIINRQHEMISSLEHYSQTLNKKLLTIEYPDEILSFMQQSLKVQVMMIIQGDNVLMEPELAKAEKDSLLERWQRCRQLGTLENGHMMALIPIDLLGKTYAELVVSSDDRVLTDYDHLILDRTATALAQFFMREMYVAEKRRTEEAESIKRWLEGNQKEGTVREYLSFYLSSVKPKGAVVCLLKFPGDIPDLTYFKLYFRSIFEQRGISFLAMENQNMMTLLLFDERNKETWKKRMEEGFEKLFSSGWKRKQKDIPLIGIGKYLEDLDYIHVSYQTALETLRIRERFSEKRPICFYENLHVYRIISSMHRQMDLRELVGEYFGEVIDHDRKYNGKLLETLKVYLSCNGSKKYTAKSLYIVRQTLYHRLEKIEALLGTDFMEQEKRLAIEFLLKAYEFLGMGTLNNHNVEK